MRQLLIIILVLFIIIVPVRGAESDIALFVSPAGNDLNSGTIDFPLKTMDGAKNKIKQLTVNNNITVYFRGGEYKISNTVSFAKTDSFDNYNITYRAYQNEKVVFSGSVKIDNSKIITAIDEAAKSRLDAGVRDRIAAIDLSSVQADIYDISDLKNIPEIVYNGKILNYAKYPNDGYLYVEQVLDKGVLNTSGAKWKCSNAVLDKLQNDTNVCVGGSLLYEWYWNLNKVKTIDTINDTIETLLPFAYSSEVGIKTKMPFYFTNSISLIDQPGEYYIDKNAKLLYFYPPDNYQDAEVEIISLSKTMIEMKYAKNITFKNITFRNGQSHGFNTNYCENIAIDNCVIENFGGNAANFWDSKNCKVINSTITDIGGSAVNAHGGNIETMTGSGFRMVNNIVETTGRINKNQAVAIWTHGYNNGTGAYVAYNRFSDMPFQAVGAGFEDIVEHNEIFGVCKASGDMGAIYIGGSFIYRGIKIRNNYIHDIPCNFQYSSFGTNGIYLDIMANGAEVYNNVVVNVSRNFYYSSEGGQNRVYNNIFVGNDKTGMYKVQPLSSQTIRVMDYGAGRTADEIKAQIPQYSYTNELWTTKYPEIKAALELEKPMLPTHLIYNNILYNCGAMAIAESAYQSDFTSIYHNWEKKINPGFMDLRYGNYQLKSDARVYCALKEFNKIDMSSIGTLTGQFEKRLKNSIIITLGSKSYFENGELKYFTQYPLIDDGGLKVSGEFLALLGQSGAGSVPVTSLGQYTYRKIYCDSGLLVISDSYDILDKTSDDQLISYIKSMLN